MVTTQIFSPKKTIKSRYAKTIIANSSYNSVTLTATKPTGSVSLTAGTSTGLVFMPYIPIDITDSRYEAYMNELIQKNREEQLKLLLDSK